MRHSHVVDHAAGMASRASRGRGMDRLARMGFVAKGVVYFLVGVLALLAAFTSRGEVTDTHGAIRTIGSQPAGDLLLSLLAAGLFAHALWRMVRAVSNPEHDSRIKRAGNAIASVLYGSLAIYAVNLAMDSGAQAGGTPQDWTARLMAQPFGPVLVGLVGFAIIGYGVYQVVKGTQERFRHHLSGMNRSQEEAAVKVGKAGHIARGVVFGIIGVFLLVAGTTANPNEAIGLDGALAVLARQSYGPWLLGIVAFGLACYGLYYVLFESRFHRISRS